MSAWSDWTAGFGPGQQLWGTSALRDAGCSVDLVPAELEGALRHLSARLGYRLGDLGSERFAVRLRRSDSVLYSAAPGTFAGLAWMKARHLHSMPMVAVIHPSSFRGLGLDTGLRAYDHVITLSRVVQEELVGELGRSRASTSLLPWGPDLDFAGYVSTGDDLVVCSGKTRRDHATLLRGLASTQVAARVHTRVPMASPGPRVSVVANAPYPCILEDLQRASVVAIPLAPSDALAGITELNDALALAKPIVMTRSRFIDVDIEAIGCGIWVDVGDAEGWRTALAQLDNDPDLRQEMGRRGREFAERHHNADLFGRGVVDAVTRVARAR